MIEVYVCGDGGPDRAYTDYVRLSVHFDGMVVKTMIRKDATPSVVADQLECLALAIRKEDKARES